MNVQGALDAPRFSKRTFDGCDLHFEARISEATRDALAELGHDITLRGDHSATIMGAGQAVLRDFANGMNYGASDPRKDGAAISELRRPSAP
jgi:gamma-glutamyltranspeptidase/glutathione hydrolase